MAQRSCNYKWDNSELSKNPKLYEDEGVSTIDIMLEAVLVVKMRDLNGCGGVTDDGNAVYFTALMDYQIQ